MIQFLSCHKSALYYTEKKLFCTAKPELRLLHNSFPGHIIFLRNEAYIMVFIFLPLFISG